LSSLVWGPVLKGIEVLSKRLGDCLQSSDSDSSALLLLVWVNMSLQNGKRTKRKVIFVDALLSREGIVGKDVIVF